MTYIEVAVAAPIYHTLTYAMGKNDPPPIPGLRVLVPLGPRRLTGYLLKVMEDRPEGKFTIRKISAVLDPFPLFPAAMIDFFRWAADYYHHPLGEVIKSALPSGLTPQSFRKITLTDHGRENHDSLLSKIDQAWLPALLEKGELGPAAVRKLWPTKARRVLEELQSQNLINIVEEVSTDKIKTKTEVCVRLASENTAGTWPDHLKKSEIKTLDILVDLMEITSHQLIARKDITKIYSGAGKAIKDLVDQGLLALEDRKLYRDPMGERPPFFPKIENLTQEQETVLESLLPVINQKKFSPFLLHGVTGSGKTEIYLQATKTTLNQDRSVLILVPEIALAAQIEGHFISRFGDMVALLHSGLSAGERFDQWQRILSGEAKVVIGARSAIFAPLIDPGLIIVDEEHDGAYKQEDGFRYQGRDMAILRGSQQQAVVLLGSATPSITSYYHASTGKYGMLKMTKRVEDRPLPEVEVVDLKSIKTTSGRPPLFSPQLFTALRENLRQGNQSLVFLNRRGYANMVLCKDCGNTVSCSHCNVTLTLHQKSQELICHYCGFTAKSKSPCPHCSSTALVGVGFGTERVEEELTSLLPNARIARLDGDTTVDRKAYLATLRAVHNHEIDILVGTQMITKGLHFPQVTLVGVVWADAGLGIPDYRAGERTFQILTQVFGRAGRGEKHGRVIVQTHNPGHYSIAMAKHHDYLNLYDQEIEMRRRPGFPPFGRLINIQLEGEDEQKVKKAALSLASLARKLKPQSADILGPAPAPIARLRGRFRWQLLLRASTPAHLKELCRRLMTTQIEGVPKKGVKLSVDVDPENML